jgi:hypothetical protein
MGWDKTGLGDPTFPRLKADTEASCPFPMPEIQAYLKREDGDFIESAGLDAQQDRRLHFVKTVFAFGRSYWIWEYKLQDGMHCYVTVDVIGNQMCVGVGFDTAELTPDQYLVADRRRSGNAPPNTIS